MKKKRTQVEIDRQIKGLQEMRASCPRKNMFGDNNWDAIDAQIAVLKGERDTDSYNDNLYHEADRANEWLECRDNEDLFEI